MNKDIRPSQHVLHVFNPCKKRKPHDEVEFVEGRYLDIVTTKNKDPNTLYFGTSKVSNKLTGIFLGDYELTSKVKDVSLISENGIVTLAVSYINEKTGKLATVKTSLPSQSLLDEIKDALELFDTSFVKTVNASFNDVYNKLSIIDSSLVEIDEHLIVLDTSVLDVTKQAEQLDTSLNELITELDNGKYNYTIHKDSGTYENGFKLVYTLFKGDSEQVDSSSIEVTDMVLKELKYIDSSNIIEARIWPEPIDSIDNKGNITLPDGTVIESTLNSLDSKLIKTVLLNLDSYDKHLNDKLNVDSSLNDRLTYVETLLKWEGLQS